jgi:hypothetical protein
MPTPIPARALASRQSENRSRLQTMHPLATALDMMGATMSFGRNEEIYGEGEAADCLYKVVSGAVRVAPHSGFSKLILRIRPRTSWAMRGRPPGKRDFHRG